MVKILIVEDERDLIQLLQYNFEREGYEVTSATEGSLALDEIQRSRPDLVILDLMLPGIDGLEVCRRLRRNDKYASLPILMLTARCSEDDRVRGLEMGADDYVTKPFSMREVVARVRALLRHHEPAVADQTRIRCGDLVIDQSAHSVCVAGKLGRVNTIEGPR